MIIEVKICDICGIEHRIDHALDERGNPKRHWSDCIDKIHLDMKSHAAIQLEWNYEVCSNCAGFIRDGIITLLKECKEKK